MDKQFRRFEMLLPLRFNNGESIPEEVIADTLLELEDQFGAVSCESQTTHGYWRHESRAYRDSLIRIYVDVLDAPEHRVFFTQFKETLKSRFQQIDIWMTTYPLDVL